MKTCFYFFFLIVITCFASCHGCHNAGFCRKKRATVNSTHHGYLHGGCRRYYPVYLKVTDEMDENSLRWLLKKFNLTDKKMNNELIECAKAKGKIVKATAKSHSFVEGLVRGARLREYSSMYEQNQAKYCGDHEHRATCENVKVCLDLLQGKSLPSTTTKAPLTTGTVSTPSYENKPDDGEQVQYKREAEEWKKQMMNDGYMKQLAEILKSLRYVIISHKDYRNDDDEEEPHLDADYYDDYYYRTETHPESSYHALDNLWKKLEDFIKHLLLL